MEDVYYLEKTETKSANGNHIVKKTHMDHNKKSEFILNTVRRYRRRVFSQGVL